MYRRPLRALCAMSQKSIVQTTARSHLAGSITIWEKTDRFEPQRCNMPSLRVECRHLSTEALLKIIKCKSWQHHQHIYLRTHILSDQDEGEHRYPISETKIAEQNLYFTQAKLERIPDRADSSMSLVHVATDCTKRELIFLKEIVIQSAT